LGLEHSITPATTSSHLQPLGLTRKLPVKPQSWLSRLSTRSRRIVRQDSILRNSRQTSQLRCTSLRPTSQISRVLYDRSNSFLLVRYAAIKPNTHIQFRDGLRYVATISVTISQFNLTRTLGNFPRLTFPSLLLDRSWPRQESYHNLRPCPPPPRLPQSPATPYPRARKEVLRSPCAHPRVPPYSPAAQAFQPQPFEPDPKTSSLPNPYCCSRCDLGGCGVPG
jgi:hypothetical protein